MTNKKELVMIAASIVLLIGVIFWVGGARAEESLNSQVNDSQSQSSSSLSNFQVNQNDNVSRSRIGDVECSDPTLDAGIAGNRTLGSGSMAYVGITIPLGDGTCGNAQEQRLYQMKRELHWAEIEQNKKNILFMERMGSLCGEAKMKRTMHSSPILAQACFDAANTEWK